MEKKEFCKLLNTELDTDALNLVRGKFCVDEQRHAVEQMINEIQLTFGLPEQ